MKLPIVALLVASSSSTDRGYKYPSEPPSDPASKRRAKPARSWRDRLRRRKRSHESAR
jgi:hypothetical protein